VGPARRARLDTLLVARGLAPSRERARALVLAGAVIVGGTPGDVATGQPARKPGVQLPLDCVLWLRQPDHPYVSRGGIKLAGALEALGVDPAGRIALDVGASTGGFTDCLLRRGARHVIAVDVGYGQLAWSLRQDPRVTVLERRNVRHLPADTLPHRPDLVVIDVSFISLRIVLEAVRRLCRPGADVLALVKPQFEVGKGEVGKGGVVRDAARRRAATAAVAAAAVALGYTARGEAQSPIAGPKGNVETFLHLGAPQGEAPPSGPPASEVQASGPLCGRARRGRA
jgi:23S rRNA (cytidine1920-2'-O)/16S rRNA (cytidine1409-2'-O)-methyltransferase